MCNAFRVLSESHSLLVALKFVPSETEEQM